MKNLRDILSKYLNDNSHVYHVLLDELETRELQ
jgi:hypothetical protein